jgi:hypothetical protein
MDNVMDKIIDSHLQYEQQTEETLELAMIHLDPAIFITEERQDILEAMIEIGVKHIAKSTIPDSIFTTISEKLIKQLTIEEMLEIGIVSAQEILEEYYNQV